MEMVYFALVAIALYVVSDRIVNLIERRRGERLEHRSILFFVIIFVLAMLSFNLIERFTGDEKPAGEIMPPATTDAGADG